MANQALAGTSRDDLDDVEKIPDDDFGGGFIVSDNEIADSEQDDENAADLKDDMGYIETSLERRTRGNSEHKESRDSEIDGDEADTELTRLIHKHAGFSNSSSGSDEEFETNDDDESLEFEYESE